MSTAAIFPGAGRLRLGWAPILLGALTVAGFAPFPLFPLPVLTLGLLFHLWQHAGSTRAAMLTGFAFGAGLFLPGVSWVYVSMHDFGGMPAPVAAAATLVFCLFLALFPAAAGLAAGLLRRHAKVMPVVAAPALWTLAEWLRGWILTGFPWLAVGYAAVPASPLAGYAPLAGVYGVSLLTAASASLLALAWEGRRGGTRRVLAPVSVLVLLWGGGALLKEVEWTRPVGAPVTVSLLQGNIPQELKWREDRLASTLETYARLVLQSSGRLVLLPETAFPLFLDELPARYLEPLVGHVQRQGGDLVFGVPERMADGRYYNSVVSAGTSPGQAYRKVHLVPFGEFVPLRPVFGWLLDLMHIPLGDFARGDPAQRPLAVAGQTLAVSICYEDAFGEEVIRQLPEATLLANVSNDAWFGDSIAPRQHLQIAQMRALETGRMMLRANNTGITALIDVRGRVVARLEPFRPGILEASAQGHSGATPYVRWGNGPAVALSALLLIAAVLVSRKS